MSNSICSKQVAMLEKILLKSRWINFLDCVKLLLPKTDSMACQLAIPQSRQLDLSNSRWSKQIAKHFCLTASAQSTLLIAVGQKQIAMHACKVDAAQSR